MATVGFLGFGVVLYGCPSGFNCLACGCGLYWPHANRNAAIVAMVSGSVVGLSAYVWIAPYCAAVFSTAVSALVMVVGSVRWPERFQWSLLKEAL